MHQSLLRPREWSEFAAAFGDGMVCIAGGTDLVPLMRAGIVRPRAIVDLSKLGDCGIEFLSGGVLAIGALARLNDVAAHPLVFEYTPAISQALTASASAQIRNMATVGGNLLQRTRCPYFRDINYNCNKRAVGSGCPALEGSNRHHALFGASTHCVATHASDLAVALSTLDANIVLKHASGPMRTVPIDEFYLPPGDRPDLETALAPGEVVVRIEVPLGTLARRSAYAKLRERASFDFTLVSTAAALNVVQGRVAGVRLALGGVAHKPWRLRGVEARLVGGRASAEEIIEAFAEFEGGAKPLRHNEFKLQLARNLTVRVLDMLRASQ